MSRARRTGSYGSGAASLPRGAEPSDSDVERSLATSQVRASLVRFLIFGLVALLVVAAGTVVVAERVSRNEVLRHAQRTARDIANTIIIPRADDALHQGSTEARAKLDRVMSDRMADGSLLRVKVWSAQSQILWSDDERLIGHRYPLEPQDAALLQTLGSTGEFTSLDREENVYDPGASEVVEVYLGFRDRSGRPMLLELYVPAAELEAESRAQLQTLLPVTLGGPALLLLILLPLALSMARRIDRAGVERSSLLRHAVAASALERRRIAGDLHDGVVQDLAGLGYALPAIGGALPEGPGADDARQKLARVSEIVRRDIAALRSVITDIYPPDLHEGGLVPASQLLFSEVRSAGIHVKADIDDGVAGGELPVDAAILGYRVLRETLRNVVRHSRGSNALVKVRVTQGHLGIEVSDDGVGFDTTTPPGAGHYGLRLLADTVRDVGGTVTINSAPGRGAQVVVRFPINWGASP